MFQRENPAILKGLYLKGGQMQFLSGNLFNKTVLSGKQYAVVLFETEWSGHCQIMVMILNKLEAEFEQKILFFHIDAEQSRDIAASFKIGRVPTLLFFRDGKVFDRITGITSEAELSARIQQMIEASI